MTLSQLLIIAQLLYVASDGTDVLPQKYKTNSNTVIERPNPTRPLPFPLLGHEAILLEQYCHRPLQEEYLSPTD